MKSIRKIKFLTALCIIAFVFYSGCVSVVEKTGRMLDGSAFAEKKITRYRSQKKKGAEIDMEITVVQNKAGEHSVIITLGDFPMMKMRGTSPNDNGEFFITSLEYLGGNVQGWNEYTLDMSGEGSLFLGETASIVISEEIEPVQISAGRIQRYDTRITGGEALASLRNRRERIIVTVKWMASVDGAPEKQAIKDFEKYWKPLLFPEMVSKKKKPSGWQREGDEFVKAEDIRWNAGYTERVFPEELRPVRNSGTLLRDWEEALSWIYLEYEWENIKKTLSRQNILQQTK